MKEEDQNALEGLCHRHLFGILVKQLGATPEIFFDSIINIHASRNSCKSCDSARPALLGSMAVDTLAFLTLCATTIKIGKKRVFHLPSLPVTAKAKCESAFALVFAPVLYFLGFG